MKKIFAISTLFLLAACAETSTDGGSIVDPLVDKKLMTGNAFLVLNADGTISGQDDSGTALAGTYTADASQICSTITAPTRFAGTRCSVPVIDGDTVLFNRRDGTQSPIYSIEG